MEIPPLASSTAKNNTQIRLTSSGTVRALIFCWEKEKKATGQQDTWQNET